MRSDRGSVRSLTTCSSPRRSLMAPVGTVQRRSAAFGGSQHCVFRLELRRCLFSMCGAVCCHSNGGVESGRVCLVIHQLQRNILSSHLTHQPVAPSVQAVDPPTGSHLLEVLVPFLTPGGRRFNQSNRSSTTSMLGSEETGTGSCSRSSSGCMKKVRLGVSLRLSG